jgi:histidyl-tRNA synthetase
MLVPLLTAGRMTASRSVPSAVLVALVDEESRDRSDDVANRLRARGIPTEVAAAPQKFGKQIRTAERRGIPYVWFPGAPADPGADIEGRPDQVKDIRSGDQVDADPDTWTPPTEDLRPQVVVSTSSTTRTQEQQ